MLLGYVHEVLTCWSNQNVVPSTFDLIKGSLLVAAQLCGCLFTCCGILAATSADSNSEQSKSQKLQRDFFACNQRHQLHLQLLLDQHVAWHIVLVLLDTASNTTCKTSPHARLWHLCFSKITPLDSRTVLRAAYNDIDNDITSSTTTILIIVLLIGTSLPVHGDLDLCQYGALSWQSACQQSCELRTSPVTPVKVTREFTLIWTRPC